MAAKYEGDWIYFLPNKYNILSLLTLVRVVQLRDGGAPFIINGAPPGPAARARARRGGGGGAGRGGSGGGGGGAGEGLGPGLARRRHPAPPAQR